MKKEDVDRLERRAKRIYYCFVVVLVTLLLFLGIPKEIQEGMSNLFLAGVMVGTISPAGRFVYIIFNAIAPIKNPDNTFRWFLGCFVCFGSLGMIIAGIPIGFVLILVAPRIMLWGYAVSIAGGLMIIEFSNVLNKG
ncbi:MAG TPA: hypothetical protein VMY36_00670 [Patescibacteria group bacterium]|nr:hypothetical protein [Patescibacteria group bacterium]